MSIHIALIAQTGRDGGIHEAVHNAHRCDDDLRNEGFAITVAAGTRHFQHDIFLVTQAGLSRSLVWPHVRLLACMPQYF
jgi:hypothetical protein